MSFLTTIKGLYIALFIHCGLYVLMDVMSFAHKCSIILIFPHAYLRWDCWQVMGFGLYGISDPLVCLGSRDESRWSYGLRENLVCNDLRDKPRRSYGFNGTYYKDSWYAKVLKIFLHLYEPYAYHRENRKCLDIHNMYLALMGFLNGGNVSSVNWKNGFQWCDNAPHGVGCGLNGLEYSFYGLEDLGIIRLLGIIKLQSSGSKGQNQYIYI